MHTQTLSAARGSLSGQDCITIGDAVLRGVRMRYERNEEIFGQDEPAEHVFRVVAGAVRTMRFSADGRRQILGFHFAGDVFGLDIGARYALAAEAVSSCELVMVRRSALDQAAAAGPNAALAVLKLIGDELAGAREHALILGRKGAGERVAAFLLQIAHRVSHERELDLPMSRADIADYLGLTIESVSRAFSEFERSAAIALPSSRHVVMRNPHALAELEAA